MHGHSEMLMHEYSFSPAQHVHLGDIPIRLGMSVVSFKPSGEACQTSGECINHLHHVHHTAITILTSWLLNSPILFVISRSFWPLITCILQCPQLMTIWSGVSLLSTVMIEMLNSWTFLWFMKWFPFGFSSNHWLITRLIQHPLVSHILLLFILYFLRSRGSHNRLSGPYKLHFFVDIGR